MIYYASLVVYVGFGIACAAVAVADDQPTQIAVALGLIWCAALGIAVARR